MSHMPRYTPAPASTLNVGRSTVNIFTSDRGAGDALLDSFGSEWSKFHSFSTEELERVGSELFDLWPGEGHGRVGTLLDIGCGSGRWSCYLAPRAGHIDALDPSSAVLKAAEVHAGLANVRWARAKAEALPFEDGVFDMVLCIGVLHHLEDPGSALREVRRVLSPGGHLYFYVYYALEQRGVLYRSLFRASDLLRRAVHRLPGAAKRVVCEVIAATVYLPLVGLVKGWRAIGGRGWRRLPLAYYHDKAYHIMRNDALDRFGTSRERRYTREQIAAMLTEAGLEGIRFSDTPPYWHGVAFRP